MVQMVLNLVLFKAGWVACVMLAAGDMPGLATLAVAAVVVVHLLIVPVPVKEALLLAAAALLGLGWESLVLATGLLQYPESSQSGVWAPHWIVAMWVLFATTINHGLAWVKRSWLVSATMGLIGGPLAFFAGAGLGAVTFTNTPLALAVIGTGWAALLPMVALISDTITDSDLLEPGGSEPSRADAALRHGGGQDARI